MNELPYAKQLRIDISPFVLPHDRKVFSSWVSIWNGHLDLGSVIARREVVIDAEEWDTLKIIERIPFVTNKLKETIGKLLDEYVAEVSK